MSFDFSFNIKEDKTSKSKEQEKKEEARAYKRKTKHKMRKAFSEVSLMNILKQDQEFKKGYSYHILTGGDIDMLSYLKFIVRYKKIDYVLLSTWCMNMTDVEEIETWLKEKRIKKMDFYVGEIFKGSYKKEYAKLQEMREKYNIKIVVFKNHSKIISGYSKDYYFNIESSANVNTNPRTENACITIDKELHKFYYDYYSNIKSFDDA